MLILKVLFGVAFVGSVTWCIASPGYEPAIAVVTSLAAFISSLFLKDKSNVDPKQNQSVGPGGIGIQAGGNVTSGNISSKNEDGSHERQ